MSKPVELSLEQQFEIRAFAERVKSLSHEESQAFLVDLYRQMIIKEVLIKEFLVEQWGIK